MNKGKYDSLLYGNGLTIAIFQKLWAKGLMEQKNDFNNFLIQFFEQKNNRFHAEFQFYFNLNAKSKREHLEAKKNILPYLEDIKIIGFERAIGKYIICKNPIKQKYITYLYLWHNYWYNKVNNEIVVNDAIKDELSTISNKLLSIVNIKENIFTTNFDTFLDIYLNPKHIHGKFQVPLINMKDIIMNMYEDGKIEYTYLFGGNGFEKLNRLASIKELSQNYYDLSFFYKFNLYIGKLLIYGMSFGKSGIISEEFLKEYPQYENLYLVRSVDGHIISKLEIMYERKMLENVVIAYYSQEDLNYLEELIRYTKLVKIVKFIHTSEVIE